MKRVYKALYKTKWIYADGYVVVDQDNTLEGIFGYDYMHIYNHDKKNILFLRTLSFQHFNKLLYCKKNIYQFFSLSIFNFTSFDNYIFFAYSLEKDGTIYISGLSLEIEEEIFDEEQIQDILLSINRIKA